MLLFVANTEYICFSTKAVCLTPFGAYVQSLRAQKYCDDIVILLILLAC